MPNAACADSAQTDQVCDNVTVPFVEVVVASTPLPLKPTDMLFTTDTTGPVDDSDPMGALFNWALWLALSVLLILGAAWIIRRERLAEVKNR